MKPNIKVSYIAGTGRSGSTIFDIVMGNQEGCFSIGELQFLPTNGMLRQEYCSCGARVTDCEFWSEVIYKWDRVRELPLASYIGLQDKFVRNKATFALLKNYFLPGEDFRSFIRDTRRLYEIIHQCAGGKEIIESSKNPQRILLLRKAGLQVRSLHIIRKFSGVLNSKKKELKKNEKAGIEENLKPRKLIYVFSTWVLENALTVLFSLGIERRRVKYEKLVDNLPAAVSRISKPDELFRQKLLNRGPFTPGHLVAGGRVRMKREVMVTKAASEEGLHNLNKYQKIFSRFVDTLSL